MIAGLVIVVLGSGAAVGDSATTLKIATLAPDGSYWVNELRASADEISRRTDGRVELRLYPGGTMGDDQAVLRKMRIGQLHGGGMLSGTLATRVPDLELYGLPLLFRSYDEVDRVRAAFDGRLLAELEANGLVAFGFIETGFAYLMSVDPVRSLDDLKGRKAWFPEGDTVGQSILEAAGLSPVPLPLSDVLTGLQTGLIETVAGPPVGAVALQWFTKARYMVEVPIVYSYGALVVADRAFASLQPADRDVVREVLTKAVAGLDARAREDNLGARDALVRQGVQILESNAEFNRQWQRVATDANTLLADRLDVDPQLRREVDRMLAELREGTGK
jgi:TRAP-type C4-dicarboxylate transport system substrate-binding protein